MKRRAFRFVRLAWGRYATPDGRFTVSRDPTGGDHLDGWGYSSWVVHKKIENGDSDGDAMFVCKTLREARARVVAISSLPPAVKG